MRSQGSIEEYLDEHLETSDRGIVLLRRLLMKQIEIVRDGGDPIGVTFDFAQRIFKTDAGNYFLTPEDALPAELRRWGDIHPGGNTVLERAGYLPARMSARMPSRVAYFMAPSFLSLIQASWIDLASAACALISDGVARVIVRLPAFEITL